MDIYIALSYGLFNYQVSTEYNRTGYHAEKQDGRGLIDNE